MTPNSIWATGQDSARLQRRGYASSSTAHPAKMLPALARHAIARFTRPGDLVLDPMCGTGTTLVEAVRAGRHAVGVEYEPKWTAIAAANLHLARRTGSASATTLLTGDARRLTELLPSELHGQVALVVASPPYGSSLHGQVSAIPGEGVVKSGDAYGDDRANLAYLPLDQLRAGLVGIFTGCHALLIPGGVLVVTARPFRREGFLVDFPGLVVSAAAEAGLDETERAVALMASWRERTLVARPSFFALDNTRKARAAGNPVALVVHEDVLIFTKPAGEVA